MKKDKGFIITGAISATLAVSLGAVGSIFLFTCCRRMAKQKYMRQHLIITLIIL